jgi:hypothetical protein
MYENMQQIKFLVYQCYTSHCPSRSKFTVTPGSEQIRATIQRDGLVCINLLGAMRYTVIPTVQETLF